MHVYTHVHRPHVDISYLPQLFSTFFFPFCPPLFVFDLWLPLNLELIDSSRLADLPVSTPANIRVTGMCATTPMFLHGYWNPNSGPHKCATRAPIPQPVSVH